MLNATFTRPARQSGHEHARASRRRSLSGGIEAFRRPAATPRPSRPSRRRWRSTPATPAPSSRLATPPVRWAWPRRPREFYRRVLALEPERHRGAGQSGQSAARERRCRGRRVRLLEPALARTPDAPELWLALGSAHRALDRLDEAERHFREALARHPDYPAALGNLADVLADRGADSTRRSRSMTARSSATARMRRPASTARCCTSSRAICKRRLARLCRPPEAAGQGAALRSPPGGLGRRPAEKLPPARHRRTGRRRPAHVRQLHPRSRRPRRPRRGARVILECEPRLVPLFARSFPDVRVMPSDMETKAGIVTARYGWLKQIGGANAAIEMGTVPRYLRADLDQLSGAAHLSGARCGRKRPLAGLAAAAWGPGRSPASAGAAANPAAAAICNMPRLRPGPISCATSTARSSACNTTPRPKKSPNSKS